MVSYLSLVVCLFVSLFKCLFDSVLFVWVPKTLKPTIFSIRASAAAYPDV